MELVTCMRINFINLLDEFVIDYRTPKAPQETSKDFQRRGYKHVHSSSLGKERSALYVTYCQPSPGSAGSPVKHIGRCSETTLHISRDFARKMHIKLQSYS